MNTRTTSWLPVILLVATLGGCRGTAMTTDTRPDFDALWNYADPAATALQFDAVLESPRAQDDPAYRAELLTQIARTQSLQRRFDDAHATLDRAENTADPTMDRPWIRIDLERGRSFNSAGHTDNATMHFKRAWMRARATGHDGLAVDAAHMLAIVDAEPGQLQWNHRGMELARESADPDAQRWLGSLCNNIGWSHHNNGDFEAALQSFEDALAHRIEAGKEADIRVAQWCVARCLRSLTRIEEALAIQQQLNATSDPEQPDGYVAEELAECLHALGRIDEARPWFKRASELLGQDQWLRENEPDRLRRLAEHAKGT